MIAKLGSYALIGALVVCLGLAAALWWQSGDIDALQDENEALRLSLAGCTARAANRSEDMKSDAQVDNMPDLTVVPPGWLLPPQPGSGGLY